MFKKLFSLLIIAVLVISSVGAVAAADKFITVYSRTQENDGDGEILFFDTDNKYMTELPIHKGDTVRINLTELDHWFQGRYLARMAFHSKKRHHCYNSNVEGIMYYKYCPVWENVTDFTVNVNFYKKRGYLNKMMFPNGWYSRDDYWCNNVRWDPVQNARFDDAFQVIRKTWDSI
jgi:hypothetical protein